MKNQNEEITETAERVFIIKLQVYIYDRQIR